MSETPGLSVVIPTYNREARLRRVLAALAAQTCPRGRFEVVVVSDGSTDGTDEYLRDAADRGELVFEAQTNQGPAAARNRGVELARGDLVLFVDDDVVAAPDLVEQHVASHEREPAGRELVVIGPMLTPGDAELSPWVRWEQKMLYKQYGAMGRGEYSATFKQFYTGNASLPRALLLKVGGFDARFRRAEDIELAYRLDEAGARFEFNPDAIGHHYAERSFDAWLRNAYEYGANDVIFARDHNRPRVLKMIGREFSERHGFIRWMTNACLQRPRLSRVAGATFRAIAAASEAARVRKVNQQALSALYNLTYYQGMADELGGVDEFHRLVGHPSR